MRFILYKIGNSYQLVAPYIEELVEIDGKRFQEFKKGWISEKPKEVYIVKKKNVVDYYENKENGKRYSPEEFQEMLDKYTTGYNEDYYPLFANIDDEYKYKKLLEEHRSVEKTIEEKIPVEIVEYDITGITDNPHIRPLRYLGKTPIDEKDSKILYQYNPNLPEIAFEIARKLSIKTLEIPYMNDNDLRFAKMFGKYIEYKNLPTAKEFIGSYEECKKMYSEDYSAIYTVLEREKLKHEAKSKNFDRKMVVSELEKIRNRIRDLKKGRNFYEDKASIVENTDKLIDKILKGEK